MRKGGGMRHSSSHALIPCQPLMIAQLINARREAQNNVGGALLKKRASDAAGEIVNDNSSGIHFTMEEEEENSAGLGADEFSSLNASRGNELNQIGQSKQLLLSTSATRVGGDTTM